MVMLSFKWDGSKDAQNHEIDFLSIWRQESFN